MKMKIILLIVVTFSLAIASGAAALVATNIQAQGSSEANAASTILTKIDTYEVVYFSGQLHDYPRQIRLLNGGKYIGQLLFWPDGQTLPSDGALFGVVQLCYHESDYQNCIDLLRNENPVYLEWTGSSGPNDIKTLTTEPVGEGENAAALVLSSPNGGQSWNRGSVRTITWISFGSPGAYVKIDLYKGGAFNRTIASSVANNGIFYWTISPTQAAGTDYKIKITSTSLTTVTDISDNNFAITT